MNLNLFYFIFGLGESSPNYILNEQKCILSFYYFLCLKVNLDLEKTNQLDESSPNFIFAVVNLDPIILEKRWIVDKSWPNDFVEKVNRGEDLRWVVSRCPVTRALTAHNWQIWKRVFLPCPWHKIYRVEAVGLKSSNYTWKIMTFANMWNLGQFREKFIFCQ